MGFRIFIWWRVLQLGIIALFAAGTYYAGNGFVLPTTIHTRLSPLLFIVHILMFPLTLTSLGLFAYQVIIDRQLETVSKQLSLSILLAMDAFVLYYSSKAEVLSCFPFLMDQCTLSSLPAIATSKIKTTAPSWESISLTNTIAIIYFVIALGVLPCLAFQLVRLTLGDRARAKGWIHKVNPALKGVDIIPSPDSRPSTVQPAVNPIWKGAKSIDASAADVASNPNPNPNPNPSNPIFRGQEYYLKLVTSKRRLELIGCAAGFLLVLPICAYLSTRLGNSFQWMFPAGIAIWTGEHTISPVIPTVRMSKNTSLKLFPQMIIFYFSLYAVSVVALLAQVDSRVLHFLQQKIQVHRFTQSSLTYGQAMLGLLFGSFVGAIFYYVLLAWYFQPRPWFSEYFENERWSRALGQTAAAIMGVMLLPVSRNSIWSSVFAVPWEHMIAFHRWLARLFLVVTAAHMIGFWFLFIRMRIFPVALFSAPNAYQSYDMTITPVSALMIFLIFPGMGLLSMERYRRGMFELFYYTHHYLALVTLLITVWHANFGWYYLLPGMLFWGFDNALRFSKSCREAHLVSGRVHELDGIDGAEGAKCFELVVELQFLLEDKAVRAEMGQYVFLSIPSISALELHPFSLSSSPLDDASSVHMRCAGPGSFTRKVAEMVLASRVKDEDGLNAEKGSEMLGLQLVVDGPYGLPFRDMQAPMLLLLAGGIGITPLHSIFRTLLLLAESAPGDPWSRSKHVKIVWGMRDPSMFNLFDSTWRKLEEHRAVARQGHDIPSTSFSASFYCSKPGYAREMLRLQSDQRISNLRPGASKWDQELGTPPNASSLAFRIPTPGRMDLAQELRPLMGVIGALCVVCGPQGLVQECAEIAAALNIACQGEIFRL